ncbi:hypothetical protein KPL78_04185 [Roseomonas sp. HJA6]|uniref:Uncharacterized protein n=2 Tax=Roseomonas alba TaxID=2846776 RepID=A0ABS7A406_9PROT|nr:hypothetical protein [Neoroseomonas alba]
MITIDPSIVSAAEKLVRAEGKLSEHRAVTAKAREAANGIRARIADLDAKRAAIGARRQNGDVRDGDAGELDLIVLDREGLAELGREANALLAAKEKEEAAAAAAVRDAHAGLQYAEDQAALAALKEHLDALNGRAKETLAQMAEVAGRIDGHAALAVIKPAADRAGEVLQHTVDLMAATGRRIGSHNFNWEPAGSLMEVLRRATIAGRPL